MVRNYVRKTERSKWLESNLNKAMKEVKKKNLSIRKAAAFYNVPKSTLERHVNAKVNNPGTTSLGNFKPALSPSLENQLVEHAKKLQDMFFGLTPESLRVLAFDIAKANHFDVTVPLCPSFGVKRDNF